MATIITTDSGSNPRNRDNMAPCVIYDSKNNLYYDMKKINDDNIRIIGGMEILERARNGERFHTAGPNPNDLVSIMRPHIEQGNKIIHLAMSSGISAGSVSSAKVTADMLNDEFGNVVTVIDTLTGGSGGTIMNDYAYTLARAGLSYDEIIKRILDVRSRLLTSFYISRAEGFIRSGRLPKGFRLADGFAIRYRVDVNSSGKLVPKLPPHRNPDVNKGFMKYLKNIINEDNKGIYDPNYFALLTTKLEGIDIEAAKAYIASLNYFSNDLITDIPFYSAISAYGVEDQVGIALIKKYGK